MINEILSMYKNGALIEEIAETFNISYTKTYRMIKNSGIPMRTQSESKKISVMKGRHNNPTKGKPRSFEDKLKISQAVTSAFQNTPPDKKQEFIETCKAVYNRKTDEQKEKWKNLGAKAVQRAGKIGSKMELYLQRYLQDAGYVVEIHSKVIIRNQNMHLDLFLPQESIAIEVDGPTHLRPVYSQENYEKKKKRDDAKNGLLLQEGYSIIRLGCEKAKSKGRMNALCQEVIETIQQLPQSNTKLFYIGDYNV